MSRLLHCVCSLITELLYASLIVSAWNASYSTESVGQCVEGAYACLKDDKHPHSPLTAYNKIMVVRYGSRTSSLNVPDILVACATCHAFKPTRGFVVLSTCEGRPLWSTQHLYHAPETC